MNYYVVIGILNTSMSALFSASGASLFSQAYGKLSVGLVLSNEAWRLSGKVDLDLSTTGQRAVSASGTVGVAF